MNSSLLQPQIVTLAVTDTDAQKRIDKFLAEQLPHYSRSFFERLLDDGRVILNNKPVERKSTKLKSGDTVEVHITPQNLKKDPTTVKADLKKYPVEVLHETDDVLVLNKPAGLLVHNTTVDPTSTTLVDWILLNRPAIKTVGDPDRPGIVHRLDRNTSGIILVAKTEDAYHKLSLLFKERKIKKTYHAVVKGHPDKTGTIQLPIGRHPTQRHKMTTYRDQAYEAAHHPKVREAVTEYTVAEYFPENALVEVYPLTGRTHQIRVHLASMGHPIIGDEVYGKKSKHIERHALHAQAISFNLGNKQYQVSCNPPEDFTQAIRLVSKR